MNPSLSYGAAVFYKTLKELGTITDFEILDMGDYVKVRYKSDGIQNEWPMSSYKLLIALLTCGHSVGQQWSQS